MEPVIGERIKVSLIIFDLDGTLLDSLLDIALSVNALRRHMPLPELPLELIYTFIGDGIPVLVRRALPAEVGETEYRQGLAYFLDYYSRHMLDHTTVFPGVVEALDRLRGKVLGILTNKRTDLTGTLLKTLGLVDYFSYVLGGDKFPRRKPDPMGARYLLRATGAAPSEALLVGDTANDVQTGRQAGALTCGIDYGRGGEKLRAARPDFLITDMRQLLEIIE